MSGDNPYAPPKTIDWSADPCVTTTVELSKELLRRAFSHRYDRWFDNLALVSALSAALIVASTFGLNEVFVNRVSSDNSFEELDFAYRVSLASQIVLAGLAWSFGVAVLTAIGGRLVLSRYFVTRQLKNWPLDRNRKVAVAAGKHGLWFAEDSTHRPHKVPGRLRIWIYNDMIILSSAWNILIPISRADHSDETWEEIQQSYRELLTSC